MIVVIAILGILAAIAVPRFTGMRHEATLKAEASTAASIISAARVQEAETGDAVGGSSAKSVTNTEPTSEDKSGYIDEKYMIIPTGTDAVAYTIEKDSNFYKVIWTTKAGGSYDGKKFFLMEGEAFDPVNVVIGS